MGFRSLRETAPCLGRYASDSVTVMTLENSMTQKKMDRDSRQIRGWMRCLGALLVVTLIDDQIHQLCCIFLDFCRDPCRVRHHVRDLGRNHDLGQSLETLEELSTRLSNPDSFEIQPCNLQSLHLVGRRNRSKLRERRMHLLRQRLLML